LNRRAQASFRRFHQHTEIEMRTKYIAGAVVGLGLLIAGGMLAFNLTTGNVRADNTPDAVESDSCCVTGDCCCPGQGSCCDPAKRVAGAVKATKGTSCCVTGDCCCPGQGSCCDPNAKAKAAEGPFICPITGEELACPNCCPLNQKK
jgi:hypothetical protein